MLTQQLYEAAQAQLRRVHDDVRCEEGYAYRGYVIGFVHVVEGEAQDYFWWNVCRPADVLPVGTAALCGDDSYVMSKFLSSGDAERVVDLLRSQQIRAPMRRRSKVCSHACDTCNAKERAWLEAHFQDPWAYCMQGEMVVNKRD